MMKTKILGVLAVAAAGVMGLGLTNSGAWFTDQASTEVTAQSGRVDIQINGTASTPFTVSNLMPGVESGPYTLEVYNPATSTVPVKYRITTDNVVSDQAPPSALMDVLKVRLVHGFCDGSKPGGVNPTFSTTKAVGNLNFKSSDSIAPAGLGINLTHCFALYFSLPSSAGNDYQATSGSFDIVVDATQLENPGFSE